MPTIHQLRSLSTTTNHKDKLPPAEVSKDEYVEIYMQHVFDRKRPQAEMDGANPPPAPACHGRRSHAGQHVDLMLNVPSAPPSAPPSSTSGGSVTGAAAGV